MEKLKRNEIIVLIKVLKKKGYVIYDKPFQLNIIGRRTDSTIPNKFDDWIYVFYKDEKNNWEGYKAPITTDAGTYWLENPMVSKGTALLKEGQYINTYKIGKHKSSYDALTQTLKPVTVIRDYDRNAILDFYNGIEDTGMFGINIHRANSVGTTKYIDRHSAGCQVFSNIDDYNQFMDMAFKHRDLHGNVFTYTLIDERSYNRRKKKRIIIGTGITVLTLLGITTLTYFITKGKISTFK
jgi:hypothetical protein